MATEKKTVHDFEFVGRLINIMKILQEETDEFNTIAQPEILGLQRKALKSCNFVVLDIIRYFLLQN